MKGTIIIVDDDLDDHEIYSEAIKAINVENNVSYFQDGQSALDYLYLTNEQPFIILSDINMPRMNGLQLREKIQENDYLKSKSIPFVFISTDASSDIVRKAHALSVQGFFQKANNMDELINILQKLFNYWELSKHPNNS